METAAVFFSTSFFCIVSSRADDAIGGDRSGEKMDHGVAKDDTWELSIPELLVDELAFFSVE